jgi:hypothetical protein
MTTSMMALLVTLLIVNVLGAGLILYLKRHSQHHSNSHI